MVDTDEVNEIEDLGDMSQDELFEYLSEADPEKVDRMMKTGFGPSTDKLIKDLESESLQERLNAINSLEKKGGTSAVEPLISVLDDEDKRVRLAASDALGNINHESAVDPLVELMKNNEVARWHAHDALVEMDGVNKRAIGDLIKVLSTSDDDEAIECASSAIGKIDSQGDDTLERLIPLLSKGEKEREAATRALKEIDSDEKLEMMIWIIDEYEDAEVRKAAVEVLGESSDMRVTNHLVKALKEDDDPGVRREAAESLRKVGSQNVNVTEALEQVAEDIEAENKVRVSARKALKSIKDREGDEKDSEDEVENEEEKEDDETEIEEELLDEKYQKPDERRNEKSSESGSQDEEDQAGDR